MRTIFKKISLHFYIFLLIVLAGVGACFFIAQTIIGYYHRDFLTGIRSDLESYSTRLANHMQITGYLSTTNAEIDEELETVAEVYEGRIVITDKHLHVVFDSYGKEVGKILVSKNAIKVLNGNVIMYSDKEKEQATILLPIIPTGSESVEGNMIVIFSIKDELQKAEQLEMRAFAYSLFFLVLLVLVAFVLSRMLTAPLKQVAKNLRHISDGYMEETSQVESYREVAVISEATNNMLAKINKLEASRQEFVSNVSHELKTPMTSMKVLADAMLSSGESLPEMYREFLGDINEEIDRENAIISDLLALVRLDKSSDKLQWKPCRINEMLGVVLKRVRPMAERENIEVVFESYREVMADVDEAKMIMALTNVIENAVKYNREFGYVHVTLNADLHYCYITVEDSGAGIPEQEIPHIFDRFYRVDKDRARESGGTGLGLAITKEVIAAHKGQIRVYSREDEGTTFSIRIPLINTAYRKDKESTEETEGTV